MASEIKGTYSMSRESIRMMVWKETFDCILKDAVDVYDSYDDAFQAACAIAERSVDEFDQRFPESQID